MVAPHEMGWSTPPILHARNLAAAFLAGAWSLESLMRRGSQHLGGKPRWLRPLVRRVLEAFPRPPVCHPEDTLSAFLHTLRSFGRISPHRYFRVPPVMSPADGPPATWGVPPLTTSSALADLTQVRSKTGIRVPCFGTPKHAFEYESRAPDARRTPGLERFLVQAGLTPHQLDWFA